MRILLTSVPLHGHVLQLVPFSWALRAAGHEVLAAVPEEFTPVVRKAGLAAMGTCEGVTMRQMIGCTRDGTPIPRPADPEGRIRRSGRGFGRMAAHALEQTLRIAERWRPDLVVSEPTEYAGRMAAGRAGVPWVEHGWGLPVSSFYREAAEEELTPELTVLGLERLPDPRFLVDVWPPEVRGGRTSAPPWPVLPMRYVPYNGSTVVPDWVRAPRERPRVCVTLGSLPQDRAHPLLDGILRGLARAGAEAVLAMDDAGQVVPAGRDAPAMRAVGWLPLDQVLPACDLVVHHGGPGTTMTSFVHAVPQLVLPGFHSDTAAYAHAVAEVGAGRRLDSADVSPERIEAECRILLGDPRHRESARSVADSMARMPSPARTVSAVEQAVAAQEPACAR
ncbi:nucleotide disphospho-sugar-binding domain-containing protein [Streptomyces minutiscleroticus]|uniref:Glycosyltransferase n=1 Tax=Streptomyces roseiscleroticus TaxID=1972 RepID=A0A2Z5E4P6_9ACTN|nr:glycosyltransferase [Streptomyces roseiscleroticus]